MLAREHGYDALALAERAGALEWHLGEMLALVAELAGTAASPVELYDAGHEATFGPAADQ